jgi:hypothetical protein
MMKTRSVIQSLCASKVSTAVECQEQTHALVVKDGTIQACATFGECASFQSKPIEYSLAARAVNSP